MEKAVARNINGEINERSIYYIQFMKAETSKKDSQRFKIVSIN